MRFKQPFKIELRPNFEGRPKEDLEENSCFGKITIGDFYEHFYISPQVWSIDMYEQQWKLALQKIKTENKSCFIQNLQANNFMFMWPIYKVPSKKKLYLRNIFIVEDIYERLIGNTQLTPENIFNFIPERTFGTDLFGDPLPPLDPDDPIDKLFIGKPPTEWAVEYED